MKEQKPKLKIACIGRYSNNNILSGPEKTAIRIFEECAKKYDTIFIQYFFDGNKHKLSKKLFGFEVVLDDNQIPLYTVGVFRLIILLFKFKPDLIHIVNFERFAIFAAYYSIFSKAKVIYNSHGIITYEDSELKKEKGFYKFKNKFCEKRLLKRADIVIFPSANAKELCDKYYSIDDENIRIIPNGIDEHFHKISHNINRNGIVVLAGGKLHVSGRKFLRKFLESMNLTLNLYIIGDKDYFGDINTFGIYKFNMMNSTELADLYKNKDIFLSLNAYDTFSISTAEAMASGLIPVITKQTGMSSFVFDDVNGYVVEYDNTDDLKLCIDKLLKKNSLDKEII